MKILIPVDGSAGSDKAVRFAISIAEGKEAEIALLNVQPNYDTFNIKLMFSLEQIKIVQEESSTEVLAHAQDLVSSIPVRTLMRTGDPGKEICAEAKASGTDLIVMGHRGLSGVKRALLGSVAAHVLHETPCPVLIVP